MTISIALLNGLGLGAGLIIAIGAQNAFLLNRALKNQHQFAIALLCSLIDSALIGLGILGMGSLILSQPQLLAWGRYVEHCRPFNRPRNDCVGE